MENIVNRFDKVSVLEQIYKLKWTVEDFSKLPEGEEIKSSNIRLRNIDCNCNLYFTKYEFFVRIKLFGEFFTDSYPFLINCEAKVLDCNDKVHYSNSAEVYIKRSSSLNFPKIGFTVLNEPNTVLPNDAWYFICILKTYQIIKQRSSEIPSLKMCEENTKNSFHIKLWKWFGNKTATDVTLQIQEDKIEAHKLILSIQSPVFAKMLQNPMSESEKNTVVIDDISLAAMTELINFIYCKVETQYSFETALELYYAADKYEVFELRELCGKILSSQLTDDNASELLECADRHKDDNLKISVMEFINSNIKSCIKKDWWHELTGRKCELVVELMKFIK